MQLNQLIKSDNSGWCQGGAEGKRHWGDNGESAMFTSFLDYDYYDDYDDYDYYD